ncbi:hypothetical protein RRG08_067069 [Elysia crispata]|uniref:Cyclic nucleotide-binding domain-containing protein n=1 Tax=Elysia crispata TaxID=231223 RepID=A0AAE1B968_9GAST|nr:hypothetical protein RRG08_067069 [Elysia crispata]
MGERERKSILNGMEDLKGKERRDIEKVKPGHEIITQGDDGDNFYVIDSSGLTCGRVCLWLSQQRADSCPLLSDVESAAD